MRSVRSCAGRDCKQTERYVVSRKWFRSRAFWIGAIVVVALLSGMMLVRSRVATQTPQVAFSDVLRDLDRGVVSEVVVTGDTLEVRLSDGRAMRTTTPANYATAHAAFIPELARKGVRIDVRAASEQSAYSYGALLVGVAFVGVLGFTLYRVTSGRIPALESKTREADAESASVTFDDVAGVDEAKEEVKEIVDFLREPQGRAPRRPARHWQDAPGAIDRGRGQGAVSLFERLRFRRDVCRRWRFADSQAVP
jgi:cell division protease FtsH